MGEMLLMNSLLANCSGLALFLLFGIGDGMFAAPLKALGGCFAAVPWISREHSDYAGFAIEEFKDLVQQTASGTGYGEEPKRDKTALRRLRAATIIGKFAARKSH